VSVIQRWRSRERYFHIAGWPLSDVPAVGSTITLVSRHRLKRTTWLVTKHKASGMWSGLTRIYGRRVR
jgi:hypothetical protein